MSTIDQIAREINDLRYTPESFPMVVENILRRHWPAPKVFHCDTTPGDTITVDQWQDVVEIVIADTSDKRVDVAIHLKRADAVACANEILAAAGVPPAPSIGTGVHRPTTVVRSLVVPEDVGVGADAHVFYVFEDGVKGVCTAAVVSKRSRIARWSADGITWHTRTTTAEPREWTEADVLEGHVIVYGLDGDVSIYFDWMERDLIAKSANKNRATHLIVLPATLPEVG